jgi:DHA2 family multidrug resistance protein
VVLDKGQEDDWFGSHFITILAITAAVCLTALVIWEWFREDPIIDVRMFKSFNFATANLMMFMMGFMLFSTLVLIPEFLQSLMGYTAELAGLVLSGGGVVLLVMMPIVGRLTSKTQARATFVRQYLGLKWPERHLYHAMFNTEMGESCAATMLVESFQQFERVAR